MDWTIPVLLLLAIVLAFGAGPVRAADSVRDENNGQAETNQGENDLFRGVNLYLEQRLGELIGDNNERERAENSSENNGQHQKLIDFVNNTNAGLQLVAALREALDYLDNKYPHKVGQQQAAEAQQQQQQPMDETNRFAHLLAIVEHQSQVSREELAQTLRNILLASETCDQGSLDFLALVLQFRANLDGANAALNQFARFRLEQCFAGFLGTMGARVESAVGKLELGVFEFINGLADEIHLLDEPRRDSTAGRIKIHDLKEDGDCPQDGDPDDSGNDDDDDDSARVRPSNLRKQYSGEHLAKLRRIGYQDELQKQSLAWALNSRFNKRTGKLRFGLNRSRRLNELKSYLNEALKQPCEKLLDKIGPLYEQYLERRASLESSLRAGGRSWSWSWSSSSAATAGLSQLAYNLEVVRICRLMDQNGQSIWDNLSVLL